MFLSIDATSDLGIFFDLLSINPFYLNLTFNFFDYCPWLKVPPRGHLQNNLKYAKKSIQ